MYYAVKLDAGRNVLDALPQKFNSPRECLNAARSTFGKAGGMQFISSRLVLM